MKIFSTGAAGFIGMHMAQLLLARGDKVLGMDNLNDYYDPALKQARIAQLLPLPSFRFVQAGAADHAALGALSAAERFTRVVHLAAQAGSAIRCRTCGPMCRAIGWALAMCWRPATSTGCSTSCTPTPAAYTAPTT